MPSDQVQALLSALAEFDRTGEPPAGFLAPDFELRQASSIIDTAGVFRGDSAMSESLAELRESFENLVFEPTKVLEAPGGEIVMLVKSRGRGRASQMETENDIAWVWTFRDGQAVRMQVYEEQADALAAVGLAEG